MEYTSVEEHHGEPRRGRHRTLEPVEELEGARRGDLPQGAQEAAVHHGLAVGARSDVLGEGFQTIYAHIHDDGHRDGECDDDRRHTSGRP